MRVLVVLLTLAFVTAFTSFGSAATETEDYPDTCEGYPVAEIGEAIEGTLYPPEDEEDHIGLLIEEDDVGTRVNVEYAADTFHTNIEVFTVDCHQNVVPVPQKACTKAQCPKGHANTKGKGHEMCQGQGHVSECSGSEGGTADEDSVHFTPTEAGVYVIVISIDEKSFHGSNGGGNDCQFRKDCQPCQNCVCVECDSFSTSSSGASRSDTSTSGSDGPTTQDCHFTCGGRSFDYLVSTSSDGTQLS